MNVCSTVLKVCVKVWAHRRAGYADNIEKMVAEDEHRGCEERINDTQKVYEIERVPYGSGKSPILFLDLMIESS